MYNIYSLKDKVALITGASRGIGRSIALTMARFGADIAVVYSNREDYAISLKNEIMSIGRKVEIFKCDVSKFDDTRSLVNNVLEKFKTIDILVNNAGITRDKLAFSMTDEDFSKVIDVNLKGTFNMIHHTYPIFVKNKCGKIINMSSISGLSGLAGQANYSSSKAGIIGLTKAVAKELASRNITCNAIAPGIIDTDMTKSMPDNIKENMIKLVPMKRSGTAEEVANVALFLASEASSYITGEVIRVDGGSCM